MQTHPTFAMYYQHQQAFAPTPYVAQPGSFAPPPSAVSFAGGAPWAAPPGAAPIDARDFSTAPLSSPAQSVGFADVRGGYQQNVGAPSYHIGGRAIEMGTLQPATQQPIQQGGLIGFQDARAAGVLDAPLASHRAIAVAPSVPLGGSTGVVGFVDARSAGPSVAAKNRDLSFDAAGMGSSGAVGFFDSRRAAPSQPALNRGLDFGFETSASAMPRQQPQDEPLFHRAKNLTPGQRRILEGRAGLR